MVGGCVKTAAFAVMPTLEARNAKQNKNNKNKQWLIFFFIKKSPSYVFSTFIAYIYDNRSERMVQVEIKGKGRKKS